MNFLSRYVLGFYFFLLIQIFCSLPSIAQDAHYWTEQYGTKSTLLGGAVIGSVSDLGAVFYNPAGLVMLPESGVALSGNVFQFRIMKLEDALGENLDLRGTDIGGAPDLVAGSFTIGKWPKHTFAYSYLSRAEVETDFFLQTEGTADVVAGLPGKDFYSGDVSWERSLEEEWFGLSWSYKLHEQIAVGVSQFFVLRGQSSDFNLGLQAVNDQETIGFLSRTRNREFDSYGIKWKAGIFADFAPWTAGLTLTTPTIQVYNDGEFYYQDIISQIENNENGGKVFAGDRQKDLKVTYRTPVAVGAGLGYALGKHKVQLSAEWYSGVGEYSILNSEPFVGQISKDTIISRLNGELEPVLNIGLGLELFINDNFSAYTSFATDRSAAPSDSNRFVEFASVSNNSVFGADIFQVTAGAIFKIKNTELTLGGLFAWANEETFRLVDFPDGQSDVIFGSHKPTTLSWRRWRLLVGFSLPFVSNEQS